MPRGGIRQGAGRRKGSLGKRTIGRQIINEKALRLEITSLEVMLSTMREHRSNGDMGRACAIARDAAPYVHRRLASVTADVKMSDPFEDWSAAQRHLRATSSRSGQAEFELARSGSGSAVRSATGSRYVGPNWAEVRRARVIS